MINYVLNDKSVTPLNFNLFYFPTILNDFIELDFQLIMWLKLWNFWSDVTYVNEHNQYAAFTCHIYIIVPQFEHRAS